MNIWPTATLFFNATDAWNKQTDAAIQLLELAIPLFLSVCSSVCLSVCPSQNSGWGYLGNKKLTEIRWYQNNQIFNGFQIFKKVELPSLRCHCGRACGEVGGHMAGERGEG